jgi:hypothetical protein
LNDAKFEPATAPLLDIKSSEMASCIVGSRVPDDNHPNDEGGAILRNVEMIGPKTLPSSSWSRLGITELHSITSSKNSLFCVNRDILLPNIKF